MQGEKNMAGLLREISKITKQIKNIKKAKKNISLQNAVAQKLDNYIADFLSGKIERFTAVPKKPELVGKKIIWQFWYQEINEITPKVVISCLNSVKKNSAGYEIIMLTGKNITDYIELPNFVWGKFNTGGFNTTKLSNLVRLYLLSAYGGVWLDVTIYLTNQIEEVWLQKDFFALQHTEIPPHDANIYKKFDSLYFRWD